MTAVIAVFLIQRFVLAQAYLMLIEVALLALIYLKWTHSGQIFANKQLESGAKILLQDIPNDNTCILIHNT